MRRNCIYTKVSQERIKTGGGDEAGTLRSADLNYLNEESFWFTLGVFYIYEVWTVYYFKSGGFAVLTLSSIRFSAVLSALRSTHT